MRQPRTIDAVGDPDRSNGAFEWYAREHQRGGRGVDGQHVVGVLLVSAEDRADHVDLVSEALWERRPERPVNEAARQDRLI